MISHSLKAQVKYINLEFGFWGIIDQNGNQYKPIHVPEQIKYSKGTITIQYIVRDDLASSSMWGKLIEITSFQT